MNLSLREISVERNGIFEGVVNGSGKQRLFAFGLLLVGLFLSFESSAQTTQVYNTSGTFTVPAGVTTITVEVWGGGGSGAGTTTDNAGGGGGGAGGAYVSSTFDVTPGDTYTFTVGGTQNGTTGTGQQGNPSWFGSVTTIYAEGGAGGSFTGRAGGQGSFAASIGTTRIAGANGANGSANNGGAGGQGANGGGTGGNGGGNGNGSNGNAPGGGGGGADVNSTTNRSGGAGAAGRVSITHQSVYYSRQTGDWNDVSGQTTWSTASHTGASCSCVPTINDIALIGNNHTVTIPANYNASAGILIVNDNAGGGTLNIGTDTNNPATLTVSGDITVESGGTLQTAGNGGTTRTVTIGSNIINNGSFNLDNSGSPSTAVFNGTSPQTISGSGSNTFSSVTLNTSTASVNVNNSITVNGVLTFSTNRIMVVDASSNVTLGSGASISGNGSNAYIQLDGTSGSNSQLIRTSTNAVGSLRFLFPIGTAAGGYTPADLFTTNAVTGTNPDNNSTLAVKPIYSSSVTGQLKRTFRLTTSNNDNTTTLTNARFYYNAGTDVAGTDNIATFTTISFLDSNVGTWATVTGTAPGGTGYFTAPGTAQPLSNGTYYYTIGSATPSCTAGNQTDYGTNSWIGYVYDGANSFTTYLGRITEGQNFDESFGGDFVNFPVGAGCTFNAETFSVRFKMALNVASCGVYSVIVGGDDGVRLSVDGGVSWESQALYNDHAYQEETLSVYLEAGINYLILEYYENAANNRVRFNFGAKLSALETGGQVGSDQTLCSVARDPVLITNLSAARNCAGNTPTYQWEYSTTSNFSSVTNVGTNSPTYDPPSLAAGTHYYRRRAVVGGVTVYSNTITIVAETSAGDQTTAGSNAWIGYVYDGANNFASANYLGYINATDIFDYSFCGDNCVELLTGCRVTTETFTVRYKMSFTPSTTAGYTFTIGADDGVRLSVNGVSVADDWSDHGYRETSSAVINLTAGVTYNLVLDYFENGGGNRVKFAYATGPLPVTWSFLDGYHNEGNNIIDWKTASEKNNFGFIVERSLNGTAFDSIGFVAGNGTTVTPQSYSFADSYPGNGWNYYRLKQIDYDNAFEYSKVIPVYADSGKKPGIYPNPTSSSLYISHGGTQPASDAHLLNAQTGHVIPLTPDEKQPSRYPLDEVPSGSYIISFTVDGRRFTEKVIVVK